MSRKILIFCLLILVLVVIGYLQFWQGFSGLILDSKPATIDNRIDPHPSYDSRKQSECGLACQKIKRANSPSARKAAVINYCEKTIEGYYPLKASEYDAVYKGELGKDSFCEEAGHCFNPPVYNCTYAGEVIDAEKCRNVMCQTYKGLDMEQSEVESAIEKMMDPGNCTLVKGEQAGLHKIRAKTWWQQYFQDVDCGQFYN